MILLADILFGGIPSKGWGTSGVGQTALRIPIYPYSRLNYTMYDHRGKVKKFITKVYNSAEEPGPKPLFEKSVQSDM